MSTAQHLRRVLFTCGVNDHGQLGLGASAGSSLFTAVLGLSDVDVATVATGSAHTAVSTNCGSVYTFGGNSESQLGHSPDLLSVPVPQAVELPDSCKSVSCGSTFGFAVTTTGDVWGARGQRAASLLA